MKHHPLAKAHKNDEKQTTKFSFLRNFHENPLEGSEIYFASLLDSTIHHRLQEVCRIH